MAIRKPTHKITIDPHLEKTVLDVLKELDASKTLIEVRDGKLYYGDQPLSSVNGDICTPSAIDLSIPMPSWASEENGCVPYKALKVGNGIMVEYKPIKTLGVGYAKIYIVGKDDQPFPRMKEIWGEIHRNWIEGKKHNSVEGTITQTGEIRDQYGSNAPSLDILHKFLLHMNILYSTWKYFPNVKSYKTVEELNQALSTVKNLSGNADWIENDIKQLREQIRSRQGEIANLEKKLNDMYENAADAMNLLEENGVKVDAEGKVEGIEEDGSEYFSTDNLPGEYYIDGSGLTITTSTGCSPISICSPTYDKYWSEGYSCSSGC